MSPTPARMSAYTEHIVHLDMPQAHSVGLICRPRDVDRLPELGVVVLSGGAQIRAGSHRQFVLMSRHLAAQGHAVLRFDWPGLGDAMGEVRPFDALAIETACAIQALRDAAPSLKHLVLLGLCDGASAALLYLHANPDAEIAGLCLINPWIRSEQTLARTYVKHYYLKRLAEPGFWRKLGQGGVGWKSVQDLLGNLRQMRHTRQQAPQASFQQRMASALSAHIGQTLLLISDQDITGQEFLTQFRTGADWLGGRERHQGSLHCMPGADHTCSGQQAHQALLDEISRWLQQAF
jgi:uncharacterized protein